MATLSPEARKLSPDARKVLAWMTSRPPELATITNEERSAIGREVARSWERGPASREELLAAEQRVRDARSDSAKAADPTDDERDRVALAAAAMELRRKDVAEARRLLLEAQRDLDEIREGSLDHFGNQRPPDRDRFFAAEARIPLLRAERAVAEEAFKEASDAFIRINASVASAGRARAHEATQAEATAGPTPSASRRHLADLRSRLGIAS